MSIHEEDAVGHKEKEKEEANYSNDFHRPSPVLVVVVVMVVVSRVAVQISYPLSSVFGYNSARTPFSKTHTHTHTHKEGDKQTNTSKTHVDIMLAGLFLARVAKQEDGVDGVEDCQHSADTEHEVVLQAVGTVRQRNCCPCHDFEIKEERVGQRE